MKIRFSFKKMGEVRESAVKDFANMVSAEHKRVPLIVAGEVYAELEDKLTTPGTRDAAMLNELRGGMMALRAFAVKYQEATGCGTR